MREILDKPGPIFVIGISTRSGTTHLQHLIAAHPDCWTPTRFDEDFFMFDADRGLDAYVDALTGRVWGGGLRNDTRDEVWAHLGQGLLGFAAQGAPEDRRLVLKTPSPRGFLAFGTKLFPTGTAALIVRDGRDVVTSQIASWGVDFEAACIHYTQNAYMLRAIQTRAADCMPFVLVRYEKLVQDPVAAMHVVCAALGLDPRVYDFDALANAPVRGTCTEFKEHKVAPRPRPKDFAPIGRWRAWSREQRETYERICGDVSRALGYDLLPGWVDEA